MMRNPDRVARVSASGLKCEVQADIYQAQGLAVHSSRTAGSETTPSVDVGLRDGCAWLVHCTEGLTQVASRCAANRLVHSASVGVSAHSL